MRYSQNDVPFWIKDPRILLDSDYIFNLWINKNMTKNEKLNVLTRVIILLTILGYILTKSIRILFFSILAIFIIIFLYYSSTKSENFENIREFGKIKLTNKFDDVFLDKKYFTQSSVSNPLSNVKLTEYEDDPLRKQAAPSYNKKVEQEINNNAKEFIKSSFNDENIDKKLFNDLGDNLQFENSMRQFYTTSSSTIPNDQESFLKFCYKDLKS